MGNRLRRSAELVAVPLDFEKEEERTAEGVGYRLDSNDGAYDDQC
jgi:hypothetical protein